MKEDPNLCVGRLIDREIMALIDEVIKEEQPEESMHSPTKGYEQLSHSPMNLSQLASLDEAAIQKFIEEELIYSVIYDQVEDLAIVSMQNQYFVQQNMSKWVAEEIYSELMQEEVKKVTGDTVKGERIMDKSSKNFLHVFLEEEIKKECERIYEEERDAPKKVANQSVDIIERKAIELLMDGAITKQAYEMS